MAITIEDIKQLRDATQVSVAECKNALKESGGDFERAVEILRKRGTLKAQAKESRAVGSGIIEAYVHLGGRVGVLLEIRCETDFVARNEGFKALARDIAMQIAAMSPVCVKPEDIPTDIIARERRIWEESMGLQNKPSELREKIILGKEQSYYKEACLLQQSFIKNEDISVQQLIDEAIARLGENIQVARFSRFEIV